MLKEFIFVTPVWGAPHIKLFLELGLPSLLAENNLPKLRKLSHVTYLLYIHRSDEATFQQCSFIKILSDIVDLKIIVFENTFPNNHAAMSWCHKQGFQYAIEREGYAVFIPPDCIWSNQAMLSMYHIVEQGYKLIHMSGLRLVSTLFSSAAKKYQPTCSFTPRELVKLGLKYLHPITHSHFFSEKDGGLMPANLFWTVGQDALIARCFHLHPLVAYGKSIGSQFQSTIDDDLALVFNPGVNEEYVVTDSDELIAFELSSLSHTVLAAYRKSNIEDIVGWAEISTNTKHRAFIKKTIKIHSGDTENAEWLQTEKIADAVVEQILNTLEQQGAKKFRKVWLRIRKSNNFNKILQRYIAMLKILMNTFNRMMRSPAGLYPWHWNFWFQKDVCNPFIDDLENMSGNVLYFDDKYHPLIGDINRRIAGREDLRIDLRDAKVIINQHEMLSRVQEKYYDAVIIRDFDCCLDDGRLLKVFETCLKANGTIMYYVTRAVNIKMMQAELPKSIKFVSEQTYGGLGSKIVLKWHHRSQCMSVFRYSHTLMVTVRLMFAPLLFSLYPCVSLFTFIMNKFSNKNQNWAVKLLYFSRTDA